MYFSLGDEEDGFYFLRLALKQHSCTLLEINSEPLLLALGGDSRFEKISKEFKLIEIKSLFHKSWFGKGVAPLPSLNWCQMVSEEVHTVQPAEVDGCATWRGKIA